MSFFGTLFGEIADLFGIQPKNRPEVGSVWVEKDPRFDDERTTVRVLNVGREMVRYCVVEPEKPKGPEVPPPQPDCAQVCYIRSFLRYYAPAGGRAGR